MAARVRGGAHAVVEHTVRWRRREIEGALDQEPFVPFRAGPIERRREGRQPVGVLVQDKDLWHGGPYCNATNRVGSTLQNAVTARMGPKVGKYQARSEEHTSELQSLMHTSYAVICLKKKKRNN